MGWRTVIPAAVAGLSILAAPVSEAQSSGPVSQLMPNKSDEERDLEQASIRRLLGQTSPVRNDNPSDPALIDILQNWKPPTAEQRRQNLLSEIVESLEEDYRSPRTIPEGMIIEAGVSVRLASGASLGPYRMYSSLAEGHSFVEFASGQQTMIFGDDVNMQDVPDIAEVNRALRAGNFVDVKMDGDSRFVGAVLGSVDKDGSIRMNFALVVEGQAMRVVGVAARSGSTVDVETVNGHRLTIKPVLREMKEVEQRWHKQAKQRAITPNRRPRARYPDWPGARIPQPGSIPLMPAANTTVSCDVWKTRFSNDPKVDLAKLGAGSVILTIDGSGKSQISLPDLSGAFPTTTFPDGLVTELVRTGMHIPFSGFRHLARSPTLADVLDFNDLDQPSAALSWQRIRREGEMVYRTEFFLRCQNSKPLLSGSPSPIVSTPEQSAAMARREQARQEIDRTPTNQTADVLMLDNLTDAQMAAITAVVTPGPGGIPASSPQMPPDRRNALELSFQSGRLARDGLYLERSIVPEGKAIEALLAYYWGGGRFHETWPAMFLPGMQPPPDANHVGQEPRVHFEMRVNARADGAMEFALLASIDGQEMLLSGIDVKSGGIGVIDLPGGHRFAIHATLRDQTPYQKDGVARMAAARATGPEAVALFIADNGNLFYDATEHTGPDPRPPEIIERMRISRKNEAAAYALGAGRN